MLYEIYGIAFTVTSRVVNGEVSLSDEATERLRDVEKTLTRAARTIGYIDVRKPTTFMEFGARLLRHVVGDGAGTDTWQWMRARGFGRKSWDLEALWRLTFMTAEREPAFRDDEDIVWRVNLPNGAHYFVELPIRRGFIEGLPDYPPNLPEDGALRRRVMEGVGELFWQNRCGALLDVSVDSQVFSELDMDGADYHGPLESCFDRWKEYARADLRRNVLLQGKPGTGKSTFCMTAARRLSERTLMLTAEACESLGDAEWYELMRVLGPTMVIMDDVDRLAEATLERKLRMFEEGYCNVPFVLFTSNELERLPQPMRRPGRIDQILEVSEPGDDALRDVVRRLAERESVEVTDLRVGQLVRMARDLSMAHVVERLRRARVEGWDAPTLEGDITFTSGYQKSEDDAA
jgi:hypothetical protein